MRNFSTAKLISLLSFALLVIILIAGLGFFYIQRSSQKASPTPNPSSSQSGISFPTGSDNLIKGQTYTLRWTPGSGKTQIFLIDTSLESQGESVSIADRVYNIDNNGSYEYTVPSNIPDGNYRFEIGKLSSDTFQISSSNNGSTSTSYCKSSDLQAQITLEGAAGNIYGTLTMKNISGKTCQINRNNFIQATYNVQNITVKKQGSAGPGTFTLSPNQTIYSQVHYPNGPQCSGQTLSTPVTFKYAISPSDSVTFTNQNGSTTQAVQTCASQSEITTIDIWNVSGHPITP